MEKRKNIHERVLTASSKEELMLAYHEWADRYDEDLIDELAYVAPKKASTLLKNHLAPEKKRLLDAGCGTGLVGSCLKELGYTEIDGLDYCQSMLAKAKEKDLYQNLFHADLTTSLELASNLYDAVICVGTFTSGHIGPDALLELIRIIKKGGYLCFTVRDSAWEDDAYSVKIKGLVEKGYWQLVGEHVSDYIQVEGSRCKICLYQIL